MHPNQCDVSKNRRRQTFRQALGVAKNASQPGSPELHDAEVAAAKRKYISEHPPFAAELISLSIDSIHFICAKARAISTVT